MEAIADIFLCQPTSPRSLANWIKDSCCISPKRELFHTREHNGNSGVYSTGREVYSNMQEMAFLCYLNLLRVTFQEFPKNENISQYTLLWGPMF